MHCPALMLSVLSSETLCRATLMVRLPTCIEKKICKFQMSHKKLYHSKVTKNRQNAWLITRKPRGAITPEKDAFMKNCGKRTCGIHSCRPVNGTRSRSETIILSLERNMQDILGRSITKVRCLET